MDLLDLTIGFGLRTLQIGDNLSVHEFGTSRLASFAKAVKEKNIRLEIGARGLTADRLKVYIELATFLGAPLIRFVTDDDAYRPPKESIVEIINDSLPVLSKKNIRLGIENHDRLKALELRAMMQDLDSPRVGICLDCANSLGAGEGFEHVLETLAPFTINLHIKDFQVKRLPHKMGFTVTGARVGKGMMDLGRALDKLSRYRRCESAILEQWVEPEETPELTIQKERIWAEEGIEYLKSMPHLNGQ